MAVPRYIRVFTQPGFLLFSLGLLHLGLLQNPTSPTGKFLLLGHFGTVLLWQPLINAQRQFSLVELLFGLVALGALGIFMSWGVMLVWLFLLIGAIGGRLYLYARWRVRLPLWLALVYLALACVGLVIPEILKGVIIIPELLRTFFIWAPMPLALLTLVLGEPAEESRDAVPLDLVGGVIIVFVLMTVLLGAIALMFVKGMAYLEALMSSLMLVALLLLMLAWIWRPRQGLGGLGLSLMRKMLSGNTPFEAWLEAVANLATSEESPENLVREAFSLMATWSFVRGVRWRLGREGRFGDECDVSQIGCVTPHSAHFWHGTISVDIYTPWEIGATSLWQLDMMVRVLAEFHLAREQTRHLLALGYLRAVHETGARMTHEIKNLLQSLDTLCFAMSQSEGRTPVEVQAMLSRQLPAISERLHDALDRLRQPKPEDLRATDASEWWASLQERITDHRVAFRRRGERDVGAQLYAALFDLVVDNLLRNAMEKSSCRKIEVELSTLNGACSLDVRDDGDAIPADRTECLFVVPLPSESGLGIGLYQAGRLAESVGFRLSLMENRSGCVRFRLDPQS